jgi:hypothetical protein
MRLPRGQAIRPQEDTREHWLPNAVELFAGSDGGAEHWVIIASLIDTLHRFPFGPESAWSSSASLLTNAPTSSLTLDMFHQIGIRSSVTGLGRSIPLCAVRFAGYSLLSGVGSGLPPDGVL